MEIVHHFMLQNKANNSI